MGQSNDFALTIAPGRRPFFLVDRFADGTELLRLCGPADSIQYDQWQMLSATVAHVPADQGPGSTTLSLYLDGLVIYGFPLSDGQVKALYDASKP